MLVRSFIAAALSAACLLAAPVAHAAGTDTPFIERFFPTVREPAKGLEGHTVYRPLHPRFELGREKLPLVVWSNGACRDNNSGVISFLSLLAARGIVVVANGPFDGVYPASGIGQHPEKLVAAIDWATTRGTLGNIVDKNKIVVMGRSCGGIDALVAGTDPRARSVVAINTGFFPTPSDGYGREWLAKLHTPVIFLTGGTTDQAYPNAIDNFNLVTVPAVLADNARAGHNGLSLGIKDGGGNEAMMIAGTDVVLRWIDWTVNGNVAAGQYFTGSSCTLCAIPDWTVTTKGL